jgi:hypothetical protein
VWAEWAAATHGAIDPAEERRRLWTIEVDGLVVLDLRDPATVAALDVDLADLTGPRVAAQDLAERARGRGAEGIVAPSAADPSRWNLVVMPAGFDRLRVGRSRVMHPRPPAG